MTTTYKHEEKQTQEQQLLQWFLNLGLNQKLADKCQQVALDYFAAQSQRVAELENVIGQINDIVDRQNFEPDSREFEIWKIINTLTPTP